MILSLIGVLALGRQFLYVSPDGNDVWSGRILKPNKQHTDGPLRTIVGARNLLRKLPAGTPATVYVAPGTYRITQPIVFGPEDSGSPTSDRVYSGSRDTILTGMRKISGWRRQANGWLVAKCPRTGRSRNCS
ncbi:MAG TPA: hypothetical protein VHE55_15310 [Fimbriimonadaceae bacterium]|nr:hypothetical protein [Fimbriimonadaceae bacterium]